MSNYRRNFLPGGQFFITLVTYNRKRIFARATNVERLRRATLTVMQTQPFEIIAAVVLPDHLHWLIELPGGDSDFSRRVGRIEVAFTKSLRNQNRKSESDSASRIKHRDSDI